MDSIARITGNTVRTLQREFDRRLGLSPKMYLRLKRFEQLLMRCMSNRPMSYLHTGQDLGYYDQSHIIRDFAEFSGTTPLQFLSKRDYLSLFYNTGP